MNPAGNANRRLTRRTLQLFAGLVLYGIGMALMVESRLGLTSWDVFHQGLSQVTGLSFGLVVILLGIPILLLWIPLRQRPGFGTVANVVRSEEHTSELQSLAYLVCRRRFCR